MAKHADNKVEKILIVSDCKEDRALFKAVFSNMGYKVIEATDTKQGLKKAISGYPNLIIAYVYMLIEDSFEFFYKVRANRLINKIPFIFYSANWMPEDEKNQIPNSRLVGFIETCEDSESFTKKLTFLLNEYRGDMIAAQKFA